MRHLAFTAMILSGLAMVNPSPAVAQGAADGKGAPVRREQVNDRVLALLRAQATSNSFPVRIWSRIGNGVYQSGLKRGVPKNVMTAFVRVLSFAVDFERDLHSKDYFELAYINAPGSGSNGKNEAILLFAHVSFKGRKLAVWRFRPYHRRPRRFVSR